MILLGMWRERRKTGQAGSFGRQGSLEQQSPELPPTVVTSSFQTSNCQHA